VNEYLKKNFHNLHSTQSKTQHDAFQYVLKQTDKHVDWAYDVWGRMVKDLGHEDNHVRAIAAQILCNLARKSDPEKRILKDFDDLLAVTKDERFVTARHTIQSLWKIGLAGDEQRNKLLEGIEVRFKECVNEKNCTLIRYDILLGLRKLFDISKDNIVYKKALELIEIEVDKKYRSKYEKVWKIV
jgi:hypothetical protein